MRLLLLGALLDLVTRDHDITAESLSAALGARGFGEAIEKMQHVLARQGVWQSAADVADPDAEIGLVHALALHYKSVELNKALKAAELALGDDPSAHPVLLRVAGSHLLSPSVPPAIPVLRSFLIPHGHGPPGLISPP